MALQSFWTGSTGPYLYEDTDVYPDAETHVPFYGPQVKIAESATESMHVVRLQEHNLTLSTLDSVITSSGSGTSGLSVVDSEIKSSVDTEVLDRSSADSQLQSVSDSTVSKLDSRVDSSVYNLSLIGLADGGPVENLKPVVNIEPNKLDIFAKSSGAAPDASNTIGIAIPDGAGVTFRTRAASYLSGTGQIIMADAGNYWNKGSLDGEIKTAWLYAIWDGAGIVWALAGYSGFNTVPTTTTVTDDDFFLLEAGSTYVRNAAHYCVAVAKIRYEYDTADSPDHTIQESGENAPLIQWNPKSDYGFIKTMAASITSAADIAEQSIISAIVSQSGRYKISGGINAYSTGGSELRTGIRIRVGPIYSGAAIIANRFTGHPTAVDMHGSVQAETEKYLDAGSMVHLGAFVTASSGTRGIQGGVYGSNLIVRVI